MTGHGIGMTWDKNRDVMSILDQAVINITPDEQGEGAMDVTARSAEFARRDKYMRFLGDVKIKRSNQNIEAQNVLAVLTADEKRIDSVRAAGRGENRHPEGAARRAAVTDRQSGESEVSRGWRHHRTHAGQR